MVNGREVREASRRKFTTRLESKGKVDVDKQEKRGWRGGKGGKRVLKWKVQYVLCVTCSGVKSRAQGEVWWEMRTK